MFDIGWSELVVIAIVALVVIGPKDLPQAFRVAGQWMAKARLMAQEFQSHIDEMMRQADVEDLKREFRDMTRVPEFEKLEADLMRGDIAGEAPKPADAPAQPDAAAAAAKVDPAAPKAVAAGTDATPAPAAANGAASQT
ncbi:MAG: Sec-independent protein translocase protein TatB [Alphaproteobacteria bacterium]|nr:Sec-independent protein translocase protein TatB [Alphaproteobacteria bacterium]